MAERRMFAKTIIDSDAFLDMPVTARLLYYDLSMRGDDDGFINSPKKIMRMVGASQDDMNILIAKKFIIPFENGVVVIKHWRIHNYIRKDTYKETPYKEQKACLELDENNAYRLSGNTRQLSVDEPSTQDRLGKDRLGKDSIGQTNYTVTEHLSDEDWHKLEDNYEDVAMLINFVDDSINDRSEMTEIRNPYKYIRQVAEANNWRKKEGAHT